jgi:hypothetical protein
VVTTTTTTAISVPVDIRIENVNGLYGADVRLTFDPALPPCKTLIPETGSNWVRAIATSGTYFVVINTANNVSGRPIGADSTEPDAADNRQWRAGARCFKPVGPTGVSSIHFTQVELASGAAAPFRRRRRTARLTSNR